MADKTFTGLQRERTTPRSVRRAESLARLAITAGGLGTILAVTSIFLFLVWVVMPLFTSVEIEALPPVQIAGRGDKAVPVIQAGTDGEQRMGWTLRADGRLRLFRLTDGLLLEERELFGGRAPRCWSFSPDDPRCAFGFDDGTVQTGAIQFESSFLREADVSEAARSLREGAAARHLRGLVTLTPGRQYRYDRLMIALEPADAVAPEPIELIDYASPSSGRAFGYLTAGGTLAIRQYFRRFNVMMDEWVEDPFDKPIFYETPAGRGPPMALKLDGQATMLMLIWRDGHVERFDTREAVLAAGGRLESVESFELLPEPERSVGVVGHLVGKTTLLVSDDRGGIAAWFPTRPAGTYARDGIRMARAHALFAGDGAAVTFLTPSRRTRLVAAGCDDGTVRLFHVTTDQQLVEVATDGSEPVRGLALAPKEDGLVAFTATGLQRWQMDVGHPEATVASLFGKVWYEGQERPQHTWQAEGGSDDFEPKLGLMPLIFGTLKATLFSMIIAVPIALLAALYTSEFLAPRWRSPLKSVIEMMASLPSVVLGFLAAIVLAPFVDSVLITVLCAFVIMPLMVVLGARLWQFLPSHVAVRASGMPRFLTIAATLPLALLVADLLAPAVERWCFAGDIGSWLNGTVGSNAGGWRFLLLPVGFVVAGAILSRALGPWLRSASAGWSGARCAAADLVRFALVIGGGVLLAYGLGEVLGGADPRDSIVGQYQKRNAMIVGFVMGFAIVPIIYTLAEDALSSVPQQLREGSLGCGATPWQTGWRIVVPAAMSGLFSAVMVGLGRAVGETMIVLMAAGNTAIMDWNAFNGFRTLSANIATELPEAVKGGTHYRVLFLAGLVLFAITFVVNTVAEMVRRHFRRRFADL